MVTIRELSRDGGTTVAGIPRLTLSSVASTKFLLNPNPPSILDTSLARITQLMAHLKESFPPLPNFFRKFLSQNRSLASSSNIQDLSPNPSFVNFDICSTITWQDPELVVRDTRELQRSQSHHEQCQIHLTLRLQPSLNSINIIPLAATNPANALISHQARSSQATLPQSTLCPRCNAAQCLIQWQPFNAQVPSEELEQRIRWVMSKVWASSTLEMYGAGLLAFHVFCNKHEIPESQRTPAGTDILMSFVATLAGLYTGSTICNYFYAVHAWHILHHIPWVLEDQEAIEAILKGSQALTPPSSTRPPCLPVTVAALLKIQESLDLTQSRDAAVWACAVCLFYGVA